MAVEKTKKKKRKFVSEISFDAHAMDIDSLRTMAEKDPGEFMGRCNALIESGDLSWAKVRSLPRLLHALIDVKVPVNVEVAGQTRAVMASAFPALSGSLVIAGINEAFEAVPTIGQDLVTETDSNKKVSTHVALTSEDTETDGVEEGVDFPEVGAGEETFEIRHKRNGRKMTITAETIEENDVANIADRSNQLGEIAGELVEEQTLARVTDHFGSASSPVEPFVFRPNKGGTALYSSSANTPTARTPLGNRITNNALVNHTDLDNARDRLANSRNTRGRRINIDMSRISLLVPDAKLGTALKIQGSELEPGIENEKANWGPTGRWRPALKSSPKLDDLSTSAWYFGWFQRQFTRKWKLRLEFASLFMDMQKFLDSRIAAQFRVAWDVEIGATESVYVIQNLEGTTAPFDE